MALAHGIPLPGSNEKANEPDSNVDEADSSFVIGCREHLEPMPLSG